MQGTERVVWERVQSTGTITAENALLPERLTALIEGERKTAAACTQLACRLSGSAGMALRRIRAQAENRARQLTALHFLLTGKRTCIKAPQVPFHKNLCEALRENCLSMLALQEQYGKVAAEFPAHADTLDCLSLSLRNDLRTVTGILERFL